MDDKVILYLTTHGTEVKFLWLSDFNRVYRIPSDDLRDASTAVRNVLNQIAEEYVQGRESYAPYLDALAHAGDILRATIFPADEEPVLDLLKRKPGGTTLAIVTDIAVEVPWNFVYTGSLDKPLETKGVPADFADFWLSKFKVRLRFSNASDAPCAPIRRAGIRTLLALHEPRFKTAVKCLLDRRPELHEKVTRLLQYQIGVTPDWVQCEKEWKSIQAHDSLLYIFAHRDESGKLCLEEGHNIQPSEAFKYELTSLRFKNIFKKANAKAAASNTLCFVNGCRTADEGWGTPLLAATSAAGFHGFIGSEAEVAADWATWYAVEFLYALLEEGKSVEVAYEETRERCFPMSLWYSCYAQPNFRIAPG